MQVQIGAKIKQLRKRDGRTQEAMANAIGVTAQAISRWEANGGCPDLELIPAIANYFGVTIDELFGYESDRQSKLDAMLQAITEKNKRNNGVDVCVDECIADARSALLEFPGNEKLMLCLASTLYNAGYVRHGEHHLTDADGYDILDTARHKQYTEWQEAIGIYEKLLSSLGEGQLRQTAMRELVQLYANTGEHEKAREIVSSVPALCASREMLSLNCCDGRSRAEEYERVLGKVVSMAADLLVWAVIANKNHYSAEKSAARIQDAIGLFAVLESQVPYYAQMSSLHLYLSEYLWRAGNRGGAFDALENARILARKFDAASDSAPAGRIAAQLPEVWPWWCVPSSADVALEIHADSRWDAWVKACKE